MHRLPESRGKIQLSLHFFCVLVNFGCCVRCGDEFECKYPAFTGISREIRCDLGEGDKARGGGELVAGGVFSL